ncbi:MAG: hypothetical protein QMD82_06745 [bacterium]|nr:hypothetical protein [bacterium]
MEDLKEVVDKLLKKFNENRSPECEAKILSMDKDSLFVEFSGTAASCSCCFDEHIQDFIYYLRDFTGMNFEITEMKRPNFGIFLAKFEKIEI